jgi:hypothetical protein
MHKYNNQDHSMYTAMLTVANLEGANHDLWAVNNDLDYHEEQKITSQPPSVGVKGNIPTPPGGVRRRSPRPATV